MSGVTIRVYDGVWSDETPPPLLCTLDANIEVHDAPAPDLLVEARLALSMSEKRWSTPSPSGEHLTVIIERDDCARPAQLDITLAGGGIAFAFISGSDIIPVGVHVWLRDGTEAAQILSAVLDEYERSHDI